jgi:hypothetical protein
MYLRGYDKDKKELIGHNSFGKINPILNVKVDKEVRFFDVHVLAMRGNDQFPYFWINKEGLKYYRRYKTKSYGKNNLNGWKTFEGQYRDDQPNGMGIMTY